MGLADGPPSDRHRVAVLLQGAALSAHLYEARLHLPDGWAGAAVGEDGLTLRAGPTAPGRSARLPQEGLCDLLGRLFGLGRGRRVAGRGAARRAARALHRRWRDGLLPLPPDLAVTHLLEEASFLWRDQFGNARRALAAEHRRHGRRRPWVAGPGPFRWRLLRSGADVAELQERLAAPDARGLWHGPAPQETLSELVAAGRWRAALAAAAARPPGSAEERRALADALFALGRVERALAVLRKEPAAADLGRIATFQLHLGRLRAARRTAAAARDETLPAQERLRLAAVAVRALANGGDVAAARELAGSCLEEHRRGTPRRAAHLLAAEAAWDGDDREALERHLEASARLADDPLWGWRWRQVRALAALAAGDDARAADELSTALATHRRRLPRTAAAGLWNDLGLARARRGDLAGAEKAFARSLALYRRCDGPRRTTLALANLAEVRLRRGRLSGAEAILERTTAANRAAGNVRGTAYDLLLWGRNELAHGRATAALELFGRAAGRGAGHGLQAMEREAALLTARALGWLGRPSEAAETLAGLEPPPAGHLEPEEVPALYALAGRRDDALAAARSAGAGSLWETALAGRPVPPEAWACLAALGDYRAARTVFDLECAAPGTVPGARLRAAIATFRRRGAVRLAERLEARDGGPWRALAHHLAAGHGNGGPPLRRLLADAGYPRARLWWESERDARVLVDAPGGDEELAAPCDGGRLVLRAPVIDAPLAALFQVARGNAAAVVAALRAAENGGRRRSGSPGHGIVGDSPELRRAVERAGRLANGGMPLLVLGESGTGKELVARLVHRRSRRRDGPWVAVNCAALSETLVLSDLFGHVRGAFTGADRDRAGVFETAAGGTVFLDEIGDLPASAQGMLLRVLQEGEVRRVGESLPRRVDVRVVAATHRDLAGRVRDGGFRRDLYYRLKGAVVELPPLRRRGRDVLLLADHLLAAEHAGGGDDGDGDGGPPRLARDARAGLLAHDWPGNVRELENVLSVAAALAAADGGGVITAAHLELPESGAGGDDRPPGYHQQVERFRRRLLTDALTATGGNQSAAARRLGLTRQAMSYLVRKLEITLPGKG